MNGFFVVVAGQLAFFLLHLRMFFFLVWKNWTTVFLKKRVNRKRRRCCILHFFFLFFVINKRSFNANFEKHDINYILRCYLLFVTIKYINIIFHTYSISIFRLQIFWLTRFFLSFAILFLFFFRFFCGFLVHNFCIVVNQATVNVIEFLIVVVRIFLQFYISFYYF